MARSRYTSEEAKPAPVETESAGGRNNPEIEVPLARPPERPNAVEAATRGIDELNAQIKEAEAQLEEMKKRRRKMVEDRHRLSAADSGENRVDALKRASELLAKDPNAAKSADLNHLRQLRRQVADLAQKT